MMLLMIVLTIQMTSSQVVYQTVKMHPVAPHLTVILQSNQIQVCKCIGYTIQCLADGTGVAYIKWVQEATVMEVEFQKNFKFGDCAEITAGSLYRKFTACVSSAAICSKCKHGSNEDVHVTCSRRG
jgi:hypothetical protein